MSAEEAVMTDPSNDDALIGTYEYLNYSDAAQIFRPYDPRFPEVARRVATLIEAQMPDARVEHIGSTAVPGCAGKGIVDLQLLYPPGRLADARDTLDGLGFQRQTGLDPFPEERPLRVGTIAHDGTVYRLHVHVVAEADAEATQLRYFRDQLRADPALLAEYVASKQAALASGVSNNIAYGQAKEPVIRKALANRADTP
jgi:GrpB-like predicted nucleotidyltransferase (UPF0157 family)